MMIDIQQLFGRQIITFNGAVELSLDYIMITEAVWMPRESQLREILVTLLQGVTNPLLKLCARPDSTICQINYQGRAQSFEAQNDSDAYGKALRYVLSRHNNTYIYGVLVGGMGSQMDNDWNIEGGTFQYHSCYVEAAGTSLAHLSPMENSWWEDTG